MCHFALCIWNLAFYALPSPRGGLAPQIETWHTINQLGFCQFLECQVPPQKRKTPLLKTFWRRFWFYTKVKDPHRYCKTSRTCTEYDEQYRKVFRQGTCWKTFAALPINAFQLTTNCRSGNDENCQTQHQAKKGYTRHHVAPTPIKWNAALQ